NIISIRDPDVSQTQEVRYRELNGQQQILAEKIPQTIIGMRIHGCRDSLAQGKHGNPSDCYRQA
ncbi:MAG TPA: hypothetical protein ACQGQW_00700, partial [Xylella fastidiosa subsp. pauca]